MNKFQQAISAFRDLLGGVYGQNVNNQIKAYETMLGVQPVSPLPETMPEKVGQFVRNQVQNIPSSTAGAVVSAAKISPPGQLIQQLEPNIAYNPENKTVYLKKLTVPYSKQLEDTKDDAIDFIKASQLIGYASLFRPFVANNTLRNGEQFLRRSWGWIKQPK